MLRRNRNGSLGLPTTAGGQKQRSFFQSARANDGSAASIRLTNPMVKQWRTSDRATKISYVLTLMFLLTMFIGYKMLRYNGASIWFSCSLLDCYVQITPRGRSRTTTLTISRAQLARVEMVATTYDGGYINSSPNISHETKYEYRGKKKNHKNSGANKGPDGDGNYVTYALYLNDDASFARQRAQQDPNNAKPQVHNEDEGKIVSLQPLKDFLDVTEDGSYRLIVRKFRMQQSRRRVRTMIAKVESYIKRRRHKLIMKENRSPSVVGILMMVGGLIGFLLTVLIGSFWDEDDYEKDRGRYHAPTKQKPNYAARQMPSRYEVRTSASRRQNSKFS